MKWFTACLVFEVTNHHHAEGSFFEESWVLLEAESENTAKTKSEILGRSKEETFLNANSDLVSWTFKGYRQVREFNALADGVELVSISTQHPGFTENSLAREDSAAA